MEISIIIPAFNSEKFIRSAVLSILKERISNLEILVVNDGSTDGTEKAILDLDCKIIRHASNLGVSAALNSGLSAAKGKYISFLDSDDILMPKGLLWRMQLLRKMHQFEAVGGIAGRLIDAQGKIHPLTIDCPKPLPPSILNLNHVSGGGYFSPHKGLYIFKKALLDRTGYFDEQLRMMEDTEYFLRILNQCSGILMKKRSVFLRRVHSNNLSVKVQNGSIQYRSLSPKEMATAYLRFATLGLPT